ncbi:cell wall-binding repeat-containing protein [Herbiconiux sp. 11R-BC]|uniref:cell wall-binding repeat-containing protein n=1 Tax=Herbiconiux sp. 11R-BC TaxID=3111637 RepID=UPI003C0D3455
MVIAALAGVALLPGAAPAWADPGPAADSTAAASESPVGDAGAPPTRTSMPDFSLDAYVQRAAQLPSPLVAALDSQLGESPEAYLAGADAAAAAVSVVTSLTASGVDVLSSRLEGTRLVVTVPTETDAALAEAANATAQVDPSGSRESRSEAAGLSLDPMMDQVVGGQGIFFGNSSGDAGVCSVAFVGRDRRYYNEQFLTAGHCQIPGDNGFIRALEQTRPGDPNPSDGGELGYRQPETTAIGNEIDAALITSQTMGGTLPAVGTWNSGANDGPASAGTIQSMLDYGDAVVGQTLCKSGSTTGWTCGTVEHVDQLVTVGAGGPTVNLDIVRGMCTQPGDSGGSVIAGPYAMGLVSAGSVGACTPTSVTGVFPMTAAKVNGEQYGSVRSYESNWEMTVHAPIPTITRPSYGGTLQWGQPITGTFTDGTPNYTIRVRIDGGVQGMEQIYTAKLAADLSWSVIPTGVTNGFHQFTVGSYFGSGQGVTYSGGNGGMFTMQGAPTVSRIAGGDRFSGSVEIAKRAFPGTAPVVYVATGANYPDALSAGPAAVAQGGPLLLVTRDDIPAAVLQEIRSLSPSRIVIVGGPNSVGPAVESAFRTLIPQATVERLAGADRYEASRAVVSAVFPESGHAFAATGTNFPDALSAGAAAGTAGEPVVLLNGPQSAADAASLGLFRALKTSAITVVGGPNSVSPGVVTSLGTVPAVVERLSGADRYEASIAVNRSAFSASSTVYLATGSNFPDALAGGVLAGLKRAPLYVVPTDCVPQGVLHDIGSLGATSVVLLGGPNSLSPAVASLTPCAF